MEWLNYHHLYYFWTVARTGSISQASRDLRISSPAISAQISQLEDSLGEKLFTKAGRGLALTEVGRRVGRLITALRQYQKQRRALQTAWTSLRNLRIGPKEEP